MGLAAAFMLIYLIRIRSSTKALVGGARTHQLNVVDLRLRLSAESLVLPQRPLCGSKSPLHDYMCALCTSYARHVCVLVQLLCLSSSSAIVLVRECSCGINKPKIVVS